MFKVTRKAPDFLLAMEPTFQMKSLGLDHEGLQMGCQGPQCRLPAEEEEEVLEASGMGLALSCSTRLPQPSSS